MGEIHELFVLALHLVWFAGATPDPFLGTFLRGAAFVLTVWTGCITLLIPGWPRNRTGTGTGTVGTVFVGTERGTGTSVKTLLRYRETLSRRNRQNRKPEPLESFHARTVTEPWPPCNSKNLKCKCNFAINSENLFDGVYPKLSSAPAN